MQATTESSGELKNITITTADGRVFNLGNPNSRLFNIRYNRYLAKRKKELSHG